MMTDPIADMLTRMRNALAVRKPEVSMPLSRVKTEIAEILKRTGYIADCVVVEAEDGRVSGRELVVTLKYENGRPAIQRLQRVSTPGRRVYAKKGELPVVLNHFGIAIVSTSRGMMTNKEAQQAGLGGEVLCEIA